MPTRLFITAFSIVVVTLAASVCVSDCAGGEKPENSDPPISFIRDVRPILSDKCFRCHGPDAAARQADLRLDVREAAVADRDGLPAIAPGRADASEVYRRIVSKDPDEQMPPPTSELSLDDGEREVIRRWIAAGAKYEPHWAFVPPVRPDMPKLDNATGIRNPIDAFVHSRLEEERLKPSPEAEPAVLCRRLYLDLTGLPPSPAELSEFVGAYSSADKEKAYSALVDKLLASPRYGERMAVPWLDAARYADTNGYQTDGPRYMWRWRDWVIDAFNRNLPYDQFTVEQLAGDLLPDATLDQQIATGFNRNHRMNAEGGIIAEEFLVEYVVDRVETTATVWLGLTMGCARCHDHKYDPFSQREFYRLFAYFNNVPEPGKAIRDNNSPPFVVAPTKEQQTQLAAIERRIAAADQKWRSLQPEIAAAEKKWLPSIEHDATRWTIEEGLAIRHRLDGSIVDDRTDARAAASKEASRNAEKREGRDVPTAPQIVNGKATFAAGPFGKSLEFDGKLALQTGVVPPFDSEAPFAAAVWVYPETADAVSIFGAMDDGETQGGTAGIETRLDGGRVEVILSNRILDDAIRVRSVAALPPAKWTHVAWTYTGVKAGENIKLYFDGKPAATTIVQDTLSNKMKTTESLKIGAGGLGGVFRGRLADVRMYGRMLTPDEVAIVSCGDTLAELARDDGKPRNPARSLKLREYFLRFAAPPHVRAARAELQTAERERVDLVESLPTTMVMRDVPGLRETHVLTRGEYDKPGEKVTAGLPAALAKSFDKPTTDRLALARWLVDRRNPLTARVAVNRIWQLHFGVGLVKTVEDFGLQGESPANQELLDWLAVEFIESGWDVKRLQKLIVSSATYRQSSQATPALLARDPENRLLARGPRFRLSGETVRDSALYVSGLLKERVGGPSVMPYQPAGLWEELGSNIAKYEQAHGDDLYRRSLYSYRKRTVASPMLANFDAAGREACVVRQTRTNTPLQALNLLNDVAFVEAARNLGARMMREGGASPADRITYGFKLSLCREPTKRELTVLLAGYERRLAEFRATPQAADKLLKVGESPLDAKLDRLELAAYATVGNVLLNLDEFVTKE